MPETLIESELFGYAKGAFTGAGSEKRGLFEYANGGTIFLDEIADAPLSIQAKLLRVLQEHKFRSIGGSREIAVDVRVVCATNRDMRTMIKENKFREDLFYRINVVAVHIPSLKERSEDIPLLVSHFLKGRKKVHPRTLDVLSHYNWPGNVRELKNLIERLMTFTDAAVITPDDLPREMLMLPQMFADDGLSYNESKRKITDEFNRAIISKSLLKHGGNVTKAAEDLKLERANFQRLMRRYNISSKEYKVETEDEDRSVY
jgi:transcriptional regulator with PAS, ATPase and Fis domain